MVSKRGCHPVALECKWKLQNGSSGNFASFLTLHPEAKLVVVASDAGAPRVNRAKGFVETGLGDLETAINLAMEVSFE